MTPPLDERAATVLVVDDVPDSLAFLVEALDEAGFTVLVALDGPSALERLARVEVDAILLDAMLPGMDGFEVCRRLKSQPAHAAIPVVFMTGLTETEHIVEGFRAGGIDYVTKPVRPEELIARLRTHTRNAAAIRQARDALDLAGQAVLVVDAEGRLPWRSPRAAEWLADFFPEAGEALPEALARWLAAPLPPGLAPEDAPPLQLQRGMQGLRVRRVGHHGEGERLLLLERGPRLTATDTPAVEAAASGPQAAGGDPRLRRAALTPRETEVLYWVARGKTNRDIAEICGMKPRTVTKHLEHIFEKLGVETRSAAAVLASAGL